jgi:hypothetical protein
MIRACCCGLSFHGVSTVPVSHLIEVHGIVPLRAPQAGDIVYPRPEYADPTFFVVAKARAAVRCCGCTAPIEKGVLHASQRFSMRHFCLACADFQSGTPAAHRQLRHHIDALFAQSAP